MNRKTGHVNAGLRRRVGADATHRSTRRALLVALCAGLITSPLASLAQQQPAKIPRIGYLGFNAGPARAFQQGLRELGYREGQNIRVEYRFAEGRDDRLPELAAELVRLNVEVLVAADPPSFAVAAKATGTIPLVTRFSSDPVAAGIVPGLAHPGGSVTGIFSLYSALNGKRMELLKETVASISRVMVLLDPTGPAARARVAEMHKLAKSLGLHLLPQEARNVAEFEPAFRAAARAKANGLLIVRAPLFAADNKKQLVQLAARYRLPAIYDDAEYAEAGGLASYGASLLDLSRHLATYVDKILRGARPGDLPIEQPTKFELAINMKTAKALGIKIPNSILLRADRVIE